MTKMQMTRAGVTVPTGDSGQLVSVIRELRLHPERCKAMGENARAAFDAKYERRVAFARWEAMLDSLLAEFSISHLRRAPAS